MHHHVHLGVTGLRRTGKTVFLTALLYQLKELGSKGLPAFSLGKSNSETKPIELTPGELSHSGPLQEFPFQRNFESLQQKPAVWPAPTEGESSATVTFHVKNHNRGYTDYFLYGWVGYPIHDHTITLHIHDYPGEFLLDVPMLKQSFEQWSKTTLQRMAEQCPEAADEYNKVAQLAITDDLNEQLRQLRQAYAKYVIAARDDGLEMIQPAMSLLQSGYAKNCFADENSLPFVPIPAGIPQETKLHDLLAPVYANYCRERVQPFHNRLKNCQVQVVLVDVLRIMRNGWRCYNDSKKSLEAVMQAYHHSAWFWGGAGRVVFAATKSDHAIKSERSNLQKLLAELVNKAAKTVGITVQTECNWFSALRATTDEIGTHDGNSLNCLGGFLKGNEGTTSEVLNREFEHVFPGTVPETWGDAIDRCNRHHEAWIKGNRCFDFPEFECPSLSLLNGASFKHLNFDSLIKSILFPYL